MSRSPVQIDQDKELFQRLLSGDPVATSDLAVAYFDRLVEWLQAHNPRIDDHICVEAAGDAILALTRMPDSYKSDGKLTIEAYLRMSAQGDLRNRLRKEQKHQQRRLPWNNVELSIDDGKYLGAGAPPPDDRGDRTEEILLQAVARLSEMEKQVFALMRRGVRRLANFIEVCKVAHLPKDQQRREVKRVKDRVKVKLKRAGKKK